MTELRPTTRGFVSPSRAIETLHGRASDGLRNSTRFIVSERDEATFFSAEAAMRRANRS